MQHDSIRVTVHTSFEAENEVEERAARFAFFFVIEVADFSIALPITIDEPDPGKLEAIRQTAIQDFRMLVHQIADAPIASGVTALPDAHDIGIDA